MKKAVVQKEKRAILTVIGGVCSDLKIPKGVTIEVRDYDCEGSDHPAMRKDSDGDWYIPMIFKG